MNIPVWLRRVRYNQKLIHIAGFFHLSKILRNWFNNITLPPQHKLSVSIAGVAAEFLAETKEQLESISQPLLCKGHQEVNLIEMILAKLKPGDVFCDIGANVGIFSIYAAKKIGKAGRVVAFEPSATNFKVLKNNVFLNSLKNVILFPYALGEASKMGILHLDEDRSSFVKDFANNKKKQRVKIFRGDEFIKNKSIPYPKVVKIDVEGYEYFVIRGLKKTLSNEKCEMVCCEIHPLLLPAKVNYQKIKGLLERMGFYQATMLDRTRTFHSVFLRKKNTNEN